VRSATRAAAAAGILATAFVASGCMFKVQHSLPPHSYFGRPPGSGSESRRGFELQATKNWALAGLLPYSGWATRDLLRESKGADRIEDLMIETRFSVRDTIVWVVPGFFYGYYVWAPRTIRVSGTEIREGDREP
jgi:hypothetical protein